MCIRDRLREAAVGGRAGDQNADLHIGSFTDRSGSLGSAGRGGSAGAAAATAASGDAQEHGAGQEQGDQLFHGSFLRVINFKSEVAFNGHTDRYGKTDNLYYVLPEKRGKEKRRNEIILLK